MSKELKKALYPGSFDPITLGHMDVIQRMSAHYDEIIILIADNTAKKSLFSSGERKALVETTLGHLKNVRVEVFKGLTTEYARQVRAQVILRGLRAVADFEYESAMANMNRHLAPEIETVLVFTSPQYGYISSRLVKEVAKFGGRLEEIVPPVVATALKNKL